MIAVALAACLASGASDIAQFGWLAGTWMQSRPGFLARETWLSPREGVMAGVGQTNVAGKPAFVEFMTIRVMAQGATFTALIPGQPPTIFALKPSGPEEAIFENLGHDFPQRVIYRHCGADLCARIEGVIAGKLEAETWRYRRVQ